MIALSRDRLVVLLVSALALATIIGGFILGGTPGKLRILKRDEARMQRIADGVNAVSSSFHSGNSLPAYQQDFVKLLTNYPMHTHSMIEDPLYTRMTSTTYELCTTFEAASDVDNQLYRGPKVPLNALVPAEEHFNAWREHPAGRVCYPFFVRITP